MDNKSVIRRLFDEVLNEDLGEVLDEIIARDYKENSPVPGQLPGSEGIKIKLEGLREAFPDVHFNLEDIISEGDLVAVRYHWSATHRGTFMDIPPTGKKVSVAGMDFYRLKEGKIVEHWDSIDELGLMQQLGGIA